MKVFVSRIPVKPNTPKNQRARNPPKNIKSNKKEKVVTTTLCAPFKKNYGKETSKEERETDVKNTIEHK